MPLTPKGIPYPALSAPPNVPSDLQNLADKVDDLLTDRRPALTVRRTIDAITATNGQTFLLNNLVAVEAHAGMGVASGSRLVAPVAGLYEVKATVRFTNTPGGNNAYSLNVRKNSAGSATSGTDLGATTGSDTVTGRHTALTFDRQIRLAANDYVEIFATAAVAGTTVPGSDLVQWHSLNFVRP